MKQILLVILFLILPFGVGAQFSGLDSSASLTAFPQFPQPFQEVKVTINAAGIDTTSAEIHWTLDGAAQTNAKNERNLSLTMGALGTSKKVTAVITTKDGLSLPLSLTLTASRVDLFLEADTTAPAFYQGRVLPTSGSTVRAIALPQFGNGTSPANYSYQWRLNNTVLGGGTVQGKNVISFTMPSGGNATLYVDVFSHTGALVGQKAIILPRVNPEVVFYENNPLKGIAPRAIPENFLLLGDEITFRAEPYFMNKNITSSNSLLEWAINNKAIDNPSDDPQELTLQRQGDTGRFSIGFHIRNLDDLLQGTRNQFTLQF